MCNRKGLTKTKDVKYGFVASATQKAIDAMSGYFDYKYGDGRSSATI
jgi:hypothetical protein